MKIDEAARKYSLGRGNLLEARLAFVDFLNGAKFAQERSYTEEEVKDIALFAFNAGRRLELIDYLHLKVTTFPRPLCNVLK